MLYQRLHMTFVGIVATMVDSVIVAEFAGCFFDRFFRTMARRHRPFKWRGYQVAINRCGLEETELLSLRSCGQALFHKESENSKAPREA